MLPYLAAVGVLVAAGLPAAGQAAVLAGYVLVMVTPALVMFGLRRAAGSRVEPRLRRIETWLNRNTASATAWTVGIIGVLLAVDALGPLTQRLLV